jgi:hypothetical protein
MLEQGVDGRRKTLGQRTSLAKSQSRLNDLVQTLVLRLTYLAPDLLAESRFDGNRLFFRETKCGVDISPLKEL